jgi:hypothetical protein
MRLLVSGSTRTVRALAGRWGAERLGVLLTPANRNGMGAVLDLNLPWAADNGAYSGFEPAAFGRFLKKIAWQPRCLWVACPDAVGDATATLERFAEWAPAITAVGQPVALVGQDGAEKLDLPWSACDCLFIGGTTRWKLSNAAADLAAEAKRRGKLVHMGRVNSRRRMAVAHDLGADTIDGSSASRFGDRYVHRYCLWLSQIEAAGSLF